jgi:hypothetical protein
MAWVSWTTGRTISHCRAKKTSPAVISEMTIESVRMRMEKALRPQGALVDDRRDGAAGLGRRGSGDLQHPVAGLHQRREGVGDHAGRRLFAQIHRRFDRRRCCLAQHQHLSVGLGEHDGVGARMLEQRRLQRLGDHVVRRRLQRQHGEMRLGETVFEIVAAEAGDGRHEDQHLRQHHEQDREQQQARRQAGDERGAGGRLLLHAPQYGTPAGGGYGRRGLRERPVSGRR